MSVPRQKSEQSCILALSMICICSEMWLFVFHSIFTYYCSAFYVGFFSASSSSSENDCIYQTCEEFLIMLSSSECNTACNILDNLGEITDLATCKSRTFASANFTVCHVYKTPVSVTIGDYFSICYKPAIRTPLIRCSNETSKYNDMY